MNKGMYAMKKIAILLTAAVTILISAAEPVTLTKDTAEKELTGFLPVDSRRPCEISCLAEGGLGKLRFTVRQYDAEKHAIGAHHVSAAPETCTELLEPLAKGQRSIVVKDASSWSFPEKGKIVAFGAEEDFSDLPNRKLAYYVTGITRKDNGWIIEFDRDVPFDAPAGTAVRLHRDGANISFTCTLPADEAVSKILKPSAPYGAPPDSFWRGAAYIKIFAAGASEEPVTVKDCKAESVSGERMAQKEREAAAKALREARKMAPYGFEKILKQDADEVVFLNHFFSYRKKRFHWSGVSSKAWDIPAREFGQFEIDIRSEIAAYAMVSFQLKKGEKTIRVATPYQSVTPDGVYHRYVFHPQDVAQWDPEAVLTGWTVRLEDCRENGFPVGFRAPRFVSRRNLIPGAEPLASGGSQEIRSLFPEGKYRLQWIGGKCPGAEVRFYDHLGNEIPGTAVALTPEKTDLEFTAPEMMIRAAVEVKEKASGIPLLTPVKVAKRYQPEITWRGEWIWSRYMYQGPNYSNVWFERTFDASEVPDYAMLAVMADDLSSIYLNGELIGKTFRYNKPDRFPVAGKIKKGRNVLRIMVYNLDSAAGLCADFYLRYPNGKDEFILTDGSWRCHENGKSKELPEKIESPVVLLGSPAIIAPWASRIRTVYAGPRGRFTLLHAKNGEFTAKLDHPVIDCFQTLHFVRKTSSGKSERFVLPAQMIRQNDGTVRIRYPEFRPAAEESKVFLDDDFWEIAGNRPVAELPAVPLRRSDFFPAEFVNAGTRTMLKFNGKLYDPTFYMTSEYERMMPMTRAGMHNYLVTARFENFWKGDGQYDFSQFDRNVETLLTVDPEAIFMLDIRFYMPEWWLNAHPEDASAYFEKTRRNTYDDVQALASKCWLADSEAPMRAVLEHVREKGYAGRIWGINIGDSRGNEWFWGGATAGTDFYRKKAHPGFSPADHKTFRSMLKKWYETEDALAKAWNMPGITFENAPMPDPMLRRKGSVGSLFDPNQNRQIMDWCRFRNEALAEAIVHFGTRLKELTGNKTLVGCYYGYMTELSENPNRSQLITGHNGFMKCIRSGVIDFFRAPARYTYRRPGDPNGIMQCFSSFTLRGKVVYIENDERTAYGHSEGNDNDLYAGRGTTAAESVGQINREFGMAAAAGAAQYWLDHPNGSLYEPALVEVIRKQLERYPELPAVHGYTPPETAIVADTESVYYSVDGPEGIFIPAVRGVFRSINKLAVPFRSLLIEDLLEKDLVPPHKFYIMLPALVLTKEQRSRLMERFAREKATVLWLYAAGSCYPDSAPSAKNCGDFLGLTCVMENEPRREELAGYPGWDSVFASSPWFYAESGYEKILAGNSHGRALVVSKNIDGATHIFSTLPDLPRGLMKKLMTESGVFRYAESAEDPFWIGNDIVSIHVTVSGTKQIFTPGSRKLKPILGPLTKVLRSGEKWEAIGGQSYVFLVTDEP